VVSGSLDTVILEVFSNLTDSVVLYNGNALVLAEKRAYWGLSFFKMENTNEISGHLRGTNRKTLGITR